ncbi:type II toxin-antitoxin system HicB family antitoxin [Halopenitus salinus]|uniref:Type II toxin-antitoxin system HicB family antitoxin n=1 Tax=Halopenitus salinus TaxID=1198295 RepID=A0ABD5V1Z4_9EURY
MSTDTGVEENGPTTPTRIRMELSEDGEMWIITDEDTGVTTQGETREHALEMLDEAVALHAGNGENVDDEAALLEDLGLDPDEIEEARAESEELPEFMQ